MTPTAKDFSPTHCKFNDRRGGGAEHDWYASSVVTDGGHTTSDICHNCRVGRIKKWDGSVSYFWRLLVFLRESPPT